MSSLYPVLSPASSPASKLSGDLFMDDQPGAVPHVAAAAVVNGIPQYEPYVSNLEPKQKLTQLVHQKTLELLNTAEVMAGTILGTKKPSVSVLNPQVNPQPIAIPAANIAANIAAPAANHAANPAVNVDLSDKSWKMFNNETHVHHHHHADQATDEKKEENQMRMIVGLCGLAIAGLTAFFLGKSVADGEEKEDENVAYENLRMNWEFNKPCYEVDYQIAVDAVVAKTDALMVRKQRNRNFKITLLALSFIGGGTAVAGALLGSSPLMLTAAAIGACVTVTALFKFGYECFSTRNQKMAETIEAHLAEIQLKAVEIIA